MDVDPPRDRIAAPSVNWPESEEEAFQAILHQVRKGCFEGGGTGKSLLGRTFTTDVGLGQWRSEEQRDWLNRQQSLIRARIEDLLDELDITNRIPTTSH